MKIETRNFVKMPNVLLIRQHRMIEGGTRNKYVDKINKGIRVIRDLGDVQV